MQHTLRGMALAAMLAAALFLVLFPATGHALGLGNLRVYSAVNEPLNAEIEITSISEQERRGLAVGVATRKEFEEAGIDYPPFLNQIKFTVAKRLDGRYFIQLRSDEPIAEPFLHLLVQFEWPGGRLVREYTALVDPPHLIAGRPAGIEVPRTEPIAPSPAPPAAVETPRIADAPPPPLDVVVRDTVQPEPSSVTPRVEPLAPPVTERSAAPPAVPVTQWADVSEYAVKRGDTMWSIAQRIRVDTQLSLQQVILAVYNANPDAFFGNNVNNLKAGKILKIPERAAVESTGQAQALREFRAHYDAWQEYKLKLAASSRTVKAAAPAEPEAATKVDAPKPEAAKAPTAPSAAERTGQPEELLKIVRANIEAEKDAGKKVAEGESGQDTASKERQALAERVTTLEESLASREMETRELTEKVGQVRMQLKAEARLLELESKELALAQARAKPDAAAPEAAARSETAKPESAKPEIAKPIEPPRAAPTKPAPVETAPAKPERPAAQKPAAPAPPPEQGLFASIMDTVSGNPLMPAVLGAVVLLMGGLALVYFQRRRKSIAEFEESILASDAVTTESAATTDTAGQAITTGDTSFLSDFSQGGMGNVHTDEVDPVSEAEVYLAYGRDETAEEILKDAIVKNPERHEIKLKLLEIYYQRKDAGAFETLAEELYAALGGRGGKIWERVEEMGRKLNPDNPMFRGGTPIKPATAAGGAAAGMTTLAEPSAASMRTTVAAPAAPASEVAAKSDTAFDFDVDVSPATPATSATTFDLDFESSGTAHAVPSGQPPLAGDLASLDVGTPSGNVVEFDLGEPSVEAAAALSTPQEHAPQWEVETPARAVEAETTEGAEHWDETATKLDLAKAYIDMGDTEGARSILDEVMNEGNEHQKMQAKQLAAQIG